MRWSHLALTCCSRNPSQAQGVLAAALPVGDFSSLQPQLSSPGPTRMQLFLICELFRSAPWRGYVCLAWLGCSGLAGLPPARLLPLLLPPPPPCGEATEAQESWQAWGGPGRRVALRKRL